MKTIELMAMPGDTIYRIWPVGKNGFSIATFTVVHVDIDNYPNVVYHLEKAIKSWKRTSSVYYAIQADFGKTVFLNEDDAKKAAEKKNMERGKDK